MGTIVEFYTARQADDFSQPVGRGGRTLVQSLSAFFKVVVASTIQLCGLLHVLLFSIRVQQHGTNRLPVASAS